ncbi:MAG: indolepyruvate ferredoxin oxidoreductase subunit alpha [Candidatus Thorarchaeota archaeon]|nr:MAG: indolepyruvate ferredoxin oxidoreductase subunit alpha [Candidatus Thorarchaeota archaeon]
MTVDDVKRADKGSALMLANEAVVRGALEADVKVVAFYPGSPTSEILDTFGEVLDHFKDYKMQIAANEKVALETVAGASMAGQRSFTSMKSVGMNVASDSMYSIAYTGLNAGCVCLIADDPFAHSSQSEQDGRYFGMTAYVPTIEPSTAQEALDMTKWAFEVSEKHKTLVIIRTTTRVNHQRGMVTLEKLESTPFKKNKWKDVKGQYFTVGSVARAHKAKLLDKTVAIQSDFEKTEFNYIVPGDGNVGIFTAGVCFLHAKEAMQNLEVELPIFKLGTLFPLPEKKIAEYLKSLSTLIVIEELTPYLETQIAAIAKRVNPDLNIVGKESGHFSEMLEYNVPIVEKVLALVLDKKPSMDYDAVLAKAEKLKDILPERPPIFCPGCPHRGTLWSFRQALQQLRIRDDIVFNNDIGCYSMAFLPPNEFSDSMLAMGASLGVSAGMAMSLEDKVIAMVGDSTLYHAALPGIVNLIHHNSNVTLFVLDNSVTAMTGQQFNPNSPFNAGGHPARKINMEKMFEALGADSVTIIDPYETRDCIAPIKKAIEADGFNVIISRRECALYGDRLKKEAGEKIIPSENVKDTCRSIYACVREFYCPAITIDESDGKMVIQRDLCDGCLECRQVCPVNAPQHVEVNK